MLTENLIGTEALTSGADIRVLLKAEDLKDLAAGASQVVELFPVKQGEAIELVGAYLAEPFSASGDAAIVSAKVSLGDGVDADRYMAATELNAGGANIKATTGTGTRFAYTADDTVDATVTVTAEKNVNALDAGKLLLLFRRIRLAEYQG